MFFTGNFSAHWGLESPDPVALASALMREPECPVLCHILVDVECEVVCRGLPVTTMESGDVVVLPRGDWHTMRSGGATTAAPLISIFTPGEHDERPVLSCGGGGPASRFVCGYLNYDQRFTPLVEALPTMLVVRARDAYSTIDAVDAGRSRAMAMPAGSSTWLGTTLKFTISEARAARPGDAAMLGRLTELMFVEIVREYMHRLSTGQGGWLAGLNDASVGKALRLLHADPVRDWTVDDLAREVAVSRSVLAQRFTEMVGKTPMRYLANWRMQLAKQLMREGMRSIQEVASRVGDESEEVCSTVRSSARPDLLRRPGAGMR